MGEIYLESESDKVAVIVRANAAGEPKREATVYLMADGWHAKSSELHTRHAWTGPFASPAEALSAFALPISA